MRKTEVDLVRQVAAILKEDLLELAEEGGSVNLREKNRRDASGDRAAALADGGGAY